MPALPLTYIPSVPIHEPHLVWDGDEEVLPTVRKDTGADKGDAAQFYEGPWSSSESASPNDRAS